MNLTKEFQQLIASGGQPFQIQALLDSKYQADAGLTQAFLNNNCRHCLVRKRVFVKHTKAECKAAGNEPSTPCFVCAAKGTLSYHWPEECPQK